MLWRHLSVLTDTVFKRNLARHVAESELDLFSHSHIIITIIVINTTTIIISIIITLAT